MSTIKLRSKDSGGIKTDAFDPWSKNSAQCPFWNISTHYGKYTERGLYKVSLLKRVPMPTVSSLELVYKYSPSLTRLICCTYLLQFLKTIYFSLQWHPYSKKTIKEDQPKNRNLITILNIYANKSFYYDHINICSKMSTSLSVRQLYWSFTETTFFQSLSHYNNLDKW